VIRRFVTADGLPLALLVLAEVITTTGPEGQDVDELAERVDADPADVTRALATLFDLGVVRYVES
jgi:predicted transcriptional regulator